MISLWINAGRPKFTPKELRPERAKSLNSFNFSPSVPNPLGQQVQREKSRRERKSASSAFGRSTDSWPKRCSYCAFSAASSGRGSLAVARMAGQRKPPKNSLPRVGQSALVSACVHSPLQGHPSERRSCQPPRRHLAARQRWPGAPSVAHEASEEKARTSYTAALPPHSSENRPQ
jgi:uncharacterized protein GlcG (DUF336 family)